ncbi:uncharacterized protein LOC120085317 [Benincasa hispida]|uniref:uncharacterized protein LOC120085317 n=1 Tax=Benincasa hispida TaxID=102211 RepID=UPI0019013843|nr:uncharacterized protein LOC120085317 [Benincasa hispida]XP_038897175.1 uncharacterized protein LOC120085317 [Benincasa hispida]XP_038897176.1 uncharacterized protein LOC120085317 [Benincasa hispida]XP_038897177.1 uncharacterized protein LOC120085317 [Benincasa hispida]
MPRHRPPAFSVLLLAAFSLCSSSALVSFSHGDSQISPISEWRHEDYYSDVELAVGSPSGSVVEGPIMEPVEHSIFVLAAERTRRKDPLNGFQAYTNGWNISDRHYWASVGFTAVPLFAVAAAWLLGFGLCLLVISLCYFCCGRRSYGYSRMAYALSLLFLIMFSIAAIIGCVILYTGQGRFHNSTSETLEYVVSQADLTAQKLRDISDYFAAAKLTGVDQVFLPSDVQTDIDQIEIKINSSASILDDKTVQNSNDIKDLLDSIRLALIIVAAIMLLLTFLGFLFSVFGMQLLVYILVITGWLLVTGTFILSGTFLILHNVAADTCVAMDQWVHNPSAHTALDDILPCVDKVTAQETLLKSKEVSAQLVDLVNEVITNVSNINFSPNFKPMYFNQSGPVMPTLCNPFHPDLTPRTCSSGEVDLQNATQVWGNYVCQVSPAGDICITTGRLTPSLYSQMASGVNLSYSLLNYSPTLVELQDCTFVRQTFDDIHRNFCPGLQQYSRWVYVGLATVSIAVMLSLILWIIYGRERHHRASAKGFTKPAGEELEGNKES